MVVRRPDAKWGEVPVAVIAGTAPDLTRDAVIALCRAALAGYKCPKDVVFMDLDAFPRSTSGKVMREEIEAKVA